MSQVTKMLCRVTLLLLALVTINGQRCTEESTIRAMKRPIYDFSMRILDRVCIETEHHFAFSPISTFFQLTSLAEGAKKGTLKEILNALRLTGYRRLHCFRTMLRGIVNKMEEETKMDSKKLNLIIVDEFYEVKSHYRRAVQELNDVRVLTLSFEDPEAAAAEVNELVKFKLKDSFEGLIFASDFPNRVMLMADTAYIKSDWKYPFNEANTRTENFYNAEGVAAGKVNMMHQSGVFNMTEMHTINACVLELPLKDPRVSMLFFLPLEGVISDVFDLLKDNFIAGIFNNLKLRPVNVEIPRFEILSEISNLRELLLDMGVERAFYPHLAQLKGISDFNLHASLMTQFVKIEVTEKSIAGFVRSEVENMFRSDSVDTFKANKPFAFMLVDRPTNFVLFAGMFSKPHTF